MMQIKIYNKIEEKVNEYQDRTGASKKWIADKMGITPQNLNKTFKSVNMPIEILIKYSIVLDCNIFDLFKYEVINEK